MGPTARNVVGGGFWESTSVHIIVTGQKLMLDSGSTIATQPLRCGYCIQEGLTADEKYCPQCGYPQGGTDEEQQAFSVRKAAEKFHAEIQDQKVRKARNALFWVAGLNMLPYLLSREPAVIAVGLVISGIFLGLAFWTKSKPFPAILSALILFVALNVLAMIEDPMNIFRGIVLKIIVLSALIYALREIKRPAKPPRSL